jgi:uncharacterized protein (DUF302 family)
MSAFPHQVTRLVFDIDVPFDDFRHRYEAAVPSFDINDLSLFEGWDSVLERTAELAPNGFLLYGRVDAGPLMALAGHKTRCITYLMGNHTIAETMFGHDPGVMLYAPLRTVLYEDGDGNVHFAIDQPSTRFDSFGNPDIAATGRKLDAKLAALLAALDLPVPDALTTS